MVRLGVRLGQGFRGFGHADTVLQSALDMCSGLNKMTLCYSTEPITYNEHATTY